MQKERRHRKVVAELLEAGGISGKAADPGGEGEEADQREQAEHEGIARQEGGITANRPPAAGGQNSSHGVRVEEKRER